MQVKNKDKFAKDLMKLVPDDKEILFFCVGTDRSTGDSLGPLVGMFLEEKGYDVVGTLDKPVHAMNVKSRYYEAKQKYPNHFIVAIDAVLGELNNIGKIYAKNGPLKPGLGVGKSLIEVGDIRVCGVVNVDHYYLAADILMNTRLALVMKMAKAIVEGIDEVMTLKKATKGIDIDVHFEVNRQGYWESVV